MSETRQYEALYVVSPEITEEGVTELHERVAEIVDQLGGKIDKTDNWGRRRLAYEIDRHKEGTYVLELFSGPAELVAELDRRLKVADDILRYLIVRVDEDLRKAERTRSRRQSRRQRRREARGLTAEPAPAATVSPAAGAAPAETAAPAPAATPAAASTEPPAATPAAAPTEPPAPAPVEPLAPASAEAEPPAEVKE
jgi:small subunit ribosomal protein S6